MITFIRKILPVILIGGILVGGLVYPFVTRSQESTATPVVRQSVLTNDTCAPPCWFGLIPGVSTAQDVVSLFEAHEEWFTGPVEWANTRPETFGRIDRETGYVINGEYRFNFVGDWQRPDNPFPGYSIVNIQDTLVHSVSLWIKEYITLEETLNALGNPDLIRLGAFDYDLILLKLIYQDINLSILLKTEIEDCNLISLQQDFWIAEMWHYSSVAAIEPVDRMEIDQLQPALLAYDYYDRDVPQEIWEAWLNGESNLTCSEAWQTLSEEIVLPTVMPSATPEG